MGLVALIKALPPREAVGVLFSIAYLVLAIRENIWCWPAAFISSALAVIVLFEARLYSESGLNVFYAVIAVYGWYQWRYGGHGPGGSGNKRARSHDLAGGVDDLQHVASRNEGDRELTTRRRRR